MSVKVLIADGDTKQLERAVRELTALGFEVIATPDGGDAFARFFEEAPNVVICSVNLPVLDGRSFGTMIRSQTPDVPVVLLTVEEEEAPEGFRVLREPLNVEDLRRILPELAPGPERAPHGSPGAAVQGAPTPALLDLLVSFQRDGNLLAMLDEDGLGRLARIAEIRKTTGEELVIREGDACDGFYLVIEGEVRVTLAEQDEREVARLGQGDFFGEMALLSDQPRSANVWTIGSAELLFFEKDAVLDLLRDYPDLRELLGGVAVRRAEENLWQALSGDDDVQKSLADLLDGIEATDGEGQSPAPQDGPPLSENVSRPSPAPASIESPVSPPTATGVVSSSPEVAAPASLSEAAPPTRSFWRGLLVGMAVGVAGAAALVWQFWGPTLVELIESSTRDHEPPAVVAAAGGDATAVLGDGASLPEDGGNMGVPLSQRSEEPGGDEDHPAVGPSPAVVASSPDKEEPPSGEGQAKKEGVPAQEVAPTVIPDAPAVTPESLAGVGKREMRRRLLAAVEERRFSDAVLLGRQLEVAFGLDWEAQLALAKAERAAGDAERAISLLLGFAKAYPTNVYADDAEYWAGLLLLKQGKREEAVAIFERLAVMPGATAAKPSAEQLEKLGRGR